MPFHYVHRAEVEVRKYSRGATCDRCGKKAEYSWGRRKEGDLNLQEAKYVPAGFHRIELHGGFSDSFPTDGMSYEIAICEECIKGFVDSFKTPPAWSRSIPVFNPGIDEARHTELGNMIRINDPYAYRWNDEDTESFPAEAEELLLDQNQEEIPNGIWRHYKGGLYEVFGSTILIDRELDKIEHLTLYRALYGDSEVFARPTSMWFDKVLPDGTRFAPYELSSGQCVCTAPHMKAR